MIKDPSRNMINDQEWKYDWWPIVDIWLMTDRGIIENLRTNIYTDLCQYSEPPIMPTLLITNGVNKGATGWYVEPILSSSTEKAPHMRSNVKMFQQRNVTENWDKGVVVNLHLPCSHTPVWVVDIDPPSLQT